MTWAFTTAWGAAYLLALLFTVAFCFKRSMWLAGVMTALWVVDRISVNTFAPGLALFYLGLCYSIFAAGIIMYLPSRTSNIVAGALASTAIVFMIGSIGRVSWDDAGAVQEALGAIAMIAIIWNRKDGLPTPKQWPRYHPDTIRHRVARAACDINASRSRRDKSA